MAFLMYRFLLFVLLFNFTLAQSLQITEIQPHKINEEEEWFEFSVSEIDILDVSGWKISNGSTVKKFSDYAESLLFDSRAELVGELTFNLTERALFSWTKSPLNLANDGGIIQILDQNDQILIQSEYPKTKSGTFEGSSWSEVWNFSETQYFPLIFRGNLDPKYAHTKLLPNAQSPTLSDQTEIRINEISPSNNDIDFIEVYIKSGPEKINLKYLEIKHNGTSLWKFDTDFFVKPGEYIILNVGTNDYGITQKTNPYTLQSNKKSGLSSGSGTVELILWEGTSFEQTEDFVCWKDETLSQTEAKRVEKNMGLNNWSGPCREIQDLIDNESLARTPDSIDSNTQGDFFRHFNGSSGQANLSQNQTPQATIKIQGRGKVRGRAPFFLNVTAQESTDPDGSKDIKSFTWKLNGSIFSEVENPPSYKIEALGNYLLELTIEDYSGASHTAKKEIFVVSDLGSAPTGGSTAEFQQFLSDEITKIKSKKLSSAVEENFFDIVLQNETWMAQYLAEKNQFIYPQYENIKVLESDILESPNPHWPRKIQMPTQVRERAKKNLGVLFSWRESPWPGLTVAASFGAGDDQSFERFEAMYLGF